MVNWGEISKLHVVQKLREILHKWFGADLYYADAYGKIFTVGQSSCFHYKNPLLKTLSEIPFALEFIHNDAERALEQLDVSGSQFLIYQSFLPGLKGMACRVVIEGENVGNIFCFPFIENRLPDQEREELSVLLKRMSLSEHAFAEVVSQLKKIDSAQIDYFKDLVELVVQEVQTFHSEIIKREERILELHSELGAKYRYHSMIGKSKKMQVVYQMLEKISRSESTVLIQGDNGTGKELVAKAIHYNSPRKNSLFLAQNCSAFNDNLLDSELFGHVKGAFTGAIRDKKGLFETANGGTLFLDEIGDTSLAMQVKLLRVLQEGTFLPVGATIPRKVNVRIIAATNKNLKEMISSGTFREDLYYRINVINLALPSLKERREDISLLCDHFLEKRCAEIGVTRKTVTKQCMELMLDYDWPGNVRELENEVERMMVLSGDVRMITPDMLSPKIVETAHGNKNLRERERLLGKSLKDAVEELEAMLITEGLRRCKFNKSKLAKELGISRANLIAKVERYGLDRRARMLKVG